MSGCLVIGCAPPAPHVLPGMPRPGAGSVSAEKANGHRVGQTRIRGTGGQVEVGLQVWSGPGPCHNHSAQGRPSELSAPVPCALSYRTLPGETLLHRDLVLPFWEVRFFFTETTGKFSDHGP